MNPSAPVCLHHVAQAWLHQAYLQGLTGRELGRLWLSLRAMCVAETLCLVCYAELHPQKAHDPHRTFVSGDVKRYAE